LSKNRDSKGARDRPQVYRERVEIALFALRHALIGCQTLVRYVLEQQGPDWRDSAPLDAAADDLRQARKWLRKRARRPRERRPAK
jgi:hypothetical protein